MIWLLVALLSFDAPCVLPLPPPLLLAMVHIRQLSVCVSLNKEADIITLPDHPRLTPYNLFPPYFAFLFPGLLAPEVTFSFLFLSPLVILEEKASSRLFSKLFTVI